MDKSIPNILKVSSDVMDFALNAARQAGNKTLEWFQRDKLSVRTKDDGSPVTAADIAAEQLLRALIASEYPDDAILGEELEETLGSSGRTWIIDPIDGTKAFSHGVPLYATLLAQVDQHGPALGVIFLPALNECIWAARGQGARWNGQLCRVSEHQRLNGGLVCTSGLSYWPPQAFSRVRETGARVRTWGDAYGYGLVATGRAEAMIDPECAAWDVAPIAVIIKEAGGRFSDVTGVESWQNGSALGSNGAVHEELLQCLS